MKIKLSLLLIFFLEGSLFGQNNKVQLEFTPYIRWDKYPEFTYAINPVNNYKVNITGTSWGTNALIRFYVKPKFHIKTGFGYYKYSFNKIREINSLFRISYEGRIINYYPPGPITPSITFATNKYFYNTISLNIGVEKQISLRKGIQMIYGFAITNYFTFSQYYHITYPYPGGDKFKKTSTRWFGFSACINVSLQKRVKNIIVGPAVILPVFDLWRKDTVFPEEENNKSRTKLLDGVGVGLRITIPLK